MDTTRNTVVRARVNGQLKVRVEDILKQLGLTMSEAINALFAQISLREGLPFDVAIPNKRTKRVLRESAKGKNVEKFDSTGALFDDLGI